ncbi:MAG: DUF192 domain-containing protein [Candidatus Woesearchaeota archaeon]
MIRNRTKKNIVVRHHKICDTLPRHMLGLMFHPKIKDFGLIFEFREDVVASIHMFFVFFKIDVIWLDKDKKVVDKKEHISPFTPHVRPSAKSRFFIELPDGTINKKKIKEEDYMSW